jgi:hypothetical protein
MKSALTIQSLPKAHEIKVNGIGCQATILVRDEKLPESEVETYWGGWSSPLEVVTGLRITVSGKTIWAPRSCFSDLSSINRSGISRVGKKAWKLHIDGGDAASGYDAYIYFNPSGVTKRLVRSSEESEYDYEVTRYVEKTPPP